MSDVTSTAMQPNQNAVIPPLSFISLLHSKELQDMQMMLQKISLEFDPFGNVILDEELKSFVEHLGLQDKLNDPFAFTNEVLLLLDQIETELKQRN